MQLLFLGKWGNVLHSPPQEKSPKAEEQQALGETSHAGHWL